MWLAPCQRVVFVTGKGGVGKSTVAAALARSEASAHGGAVLVEFDARGGAARALAAGVGGGPGPAKGVRYECVDYMDALGRAFGSLVRSRMLAGLIVGQSALKPVFDAVPAMRELVALERVRELAAEGAGRVIVDLPATGHGVEWLRVPSKAERFLRAGPLAELCRRIQDQVIHPRRSAVVVVSTVEPVVASETRLLCERLERELGRAPSLVVANRVPRSPEEEAVASARDRASQDRSWARFGTALVADAQRALEAAGALDRLRGTVDAPLASVPEMFADPTPAAFAAHLVVPST